ncbi:MAG: DUF3644 domain-containing protein, partial [Hoylesella saccharolytica]
MSGEANIMRSEVVVNNGMNLSEKLLEKSQEAFIVAVELYNKPTIRYRVEGFSFFICNAWELLLKSHIMQSCGEDAIYYKDDKPRTKSLNTCIKEVFTNDKDPLRINLEKIIDLRNTSTHFITEEYEQIYVPLFQSCVINYMNKLLQFFDVDITEKLGSNFLTLSVRMEEVTEDSIRARYPSSLAEHILTIMSSVGRAINTVDNTNFAIPVKHNFYITKKKDQAAVSFSISKDAEHAAFILKERHDMQKSCPYRMQECLSRIQALIEKDNIPFVNPFTPNESKRHTFNKYVFDLFVKFYNLKNDPSLCYVYDRNTNPNYSYSDKAINLIVEQIKKD